MRTTWLLALAAALAGGCGRSAEPAAGPTGQARRERIERIVVATGTIEPENEVEVRPRIPGIVQHIHVARGERVAAGAPLVEIERELLEAQVREARAALDSAEVEERYAAIDLERARALSAKGVASERAHDDARSRWERGRAAVARQKAALESLEVQLGYTRITAPVAGKILDVYVEEGDAVSPVTAVTGGTLLLSLASETSLHLKGLVDENEVSRVREGQDARIRTEAYPGRVFAGRVREISPVGQRQQNVTYFEVEVVVVDADANLLRPRMSADADIVSEVVDGALVVPETALRYQGDQIFVDRVMPEGDGKSEPVRIEVGIVDGDRVQVLGGLDEGAEVRLQ